MTTSMPPKGSSTRDGAAARSRAPGGEATGGGARGAGAKGSGTQGSGAANGSTRDWSATAGSGTTSAGAAAASARRSGTTRTAAGRTTVARTTVGRAGGTRTAGARAGGTRAGDTRTGATRTAGTRTGTRTGKVSPARAKAGTAAAVAAAAARAADEALVTESSRAGTGAGVEALVGSRPERSGAASTALVAAERPRLPVAAEAEARADPSTGSSRPAGPVDLDDAAVETITVGEARARARSRFRSPDGRRLLVTPRLRRLDGEPARPSSDSGAAGEPFVAPTNPVAKAVRRRRWERRGFVPVTPGRAKVRHRILPRSVIGISTMLLFFGLGIGFSGAAFYAYYDQRLAQNEETVSRFVNGFDKQFTDAVGAVDELRVQAVNDIRAELVPLDEFVADAQGVSTLPASVGPSVWQLETKDEAGNLLTGAAFAVLPHDDGTAFVTSYSLVAASTTEPAPAIELVKRTQRIPAQLWAWDPDRDLALVVVKEVIPPLSLASDVDQVTAVGGRVFAMSGVGGQGATASPGTLLDHSQSGLQHTAPVGTLFQGGPLVTGDGKVIGMASLGYRPNGIDPGDVRQAPDVAALCARILHCAEAADVMAVDLTTDTPPAGTPVNPGTEPAPADTPAGD
ncbi:MAG: serine protease [Acidimicrobiales bacterium]